MYSSKKRNKTNLLINRVREESESGFLYNFSCFESGGKRRSGMVNIKMVGQQFVALSCLLLGLSVSVNDAKSAAEEPDFQSILQLSLIHI